jgi:hypothetical protein
VGTSTSYRAPATPRWQAFASALQVGVPLDRLRSELFNAGIEWEAALADSSVAPFAVQIMRSFESLPGQLRASERPETAILAVAAEARQASTETGSASPALALAERALVAALVRTTAGDVSLSQLSSQDAATRFEDQRGTPGQMLRSFVGELLSQYAKHVTAREFGRMSEKYVAGGQDMPGLTLAQSKRVTRALAAEAEAVGQRMDMPAASVQSIPSSWAAVVSEAFERGRILPEPPR